MKNKKFKDDIVYSTESNIVQEINEQDVETLLPEQQKLKISLDKSGRRGKSVTLVSNFIGQKSDLDSLGRTLKTFCGVGGTVKNNTIEIQGDFRNKIREKLNSLGYKII